MVPAAVGLSFMVLFTLAIIATQPVVSAARTKRGRTRAQKSGRDPDYDEFGIERSRKGGRRAAAPEQSNLLPDRSNKNVARELRCSLCVATANEVFSALPRRRKSGARPKEFEIEAELEDICVEMEQCDAHSAAAPAVAGRSPFDPTDTCVLVARKNGLLCATCSCPVRAVQYTTRSPSPGRALSVALHRRQVRPADGEEQAHPSLLEERANCAPQGQLGGNFRRLDLRRNRCHPPSPLLPAPSCPLAPFRWGSPKYPLSPL